MSFLDHYSLHITLSLGLVICVPFLLKISFKKTNN